VYISDAAGFRIVELQADGTSETFYSWDPDEHANARTLTFGGGGLFRTDLFEGDNAGIVRRIRPDGTSNILASGLSGKIKGSVFADGSLFFSTIGGDIFRIYECAGDVTGDGVAGLDDLSTVLGNFGQSAGATYLDGDLDLDGDIDLLDLSRMLGAFGTRCD